MSDLEHERQRIEPKMQIADLQVKTKALKTKENSVTG